MIQTEKINISGSIIYYYFQRRCPYWLHLTLQKKEIQKSLSPLEQTFIQQGLQREKKYFQKLKEVFGEDCVILKDEGKDEASLLKRAEKTCELMKQGLPYICHGFLYPEEALDSFSKKLKQKFSLPFSPRFWGEPDVLVRISPKGEPPLYTALDVKTSYGTKFPQVMQVTYYAFLLSYLQGKWPPLGFLALQDKKHTFKLEAFSLEETKWILRQFLEEELWEYYQKERAFYHLHSRCRGCGFEIHCQELAKQEQDLSLLSLKRHEKQRLWNLGVRNLPELVEKLEHLPLAEKDKKQLLLKAKSFLQNKPFYTYPKKTVSEALEEHTIQVQLDSQYRTYRHHFSPGTHQVLFLHAFLEPYLNTLFLGIENQIYSSFGTPFLPIEKGIRRIEEALAQSTFLIHYGSSTKQALTSFVERHFPTLLEPLTQHLVDWKKIVQKVTYLPSRTYQLEDVVNFFQTQEGISPPLFSSSPLASSFSSLPHWEEAYQAPLPFLFRLFWESGEPLWQKLFLHKFSEYLQGLQYLYHLYLHLEERFPHLKD